MRVGIVGGGIAGLATGALLAGAGHPVELFEQRWDWCRSGGGLLLQPAGP